MWRSFISGLLLLAVFLPPLRAQEEGERKSSFSYLVRPAFTFLMSTVQKPGGEALKHAAVRTVPRAARAAAWATRSCRPSASRFRMIPIIRSGGSSIRPFRSAFNSNSRIDARIQECPFSYGAVAHQY